MIHSVQPDQDCKLNYYLQSEMEDNYCYPIISHWIETQYTTGITFCIDHKLNMEIIQNVPHCVSQPTAGASVSTLNKLVA